MNEAIPAVFAKNPQSAELYALLLKNLNGAGDVSVEEKKTCLHLTGGKAAFLGVHPRKNGLRLNIVLNHQLDSARTVKAEQVSANRYHNEVDITSPSQIDEELLGWIAEARQRTS